MAKVVLQTLHRTGLIALLLYAINGTGDAGTLLRHGASPWVMAIGGLTTAAGGLYLWHRLGPRFGLTGQWF